MDDDQNNRVELDDESVQFNVDDCKRGRRI